VLRQLAFADATTLVRLVRSEAREPIFQELPTKYARRLDAALRYPPHQVGAWIDPRVPALSLDATVTDALRVLRAAESTSHIFIEAKDHEAYLGTIAVREILRAAHGTSLGELRIDRTTPLSNRASLASVTFDARWDEFLHLPVVNRRGSLLGGLSRKTLRQSLHGQASDSDHRRHSLLHHLVGAYLVTCSSLSAMIGRSLSLPPKTPHGAGPNDH
jgi:Mg/Co/Ni transporter MgtE